MYICSPQKRAISSVGLEHLPYKQGVVGSNPTSPTIKSLLRKTFFVMCICYILYSGSLDRYYVGSTCDSMDNRLRKHNSAHKGFTGKADDWQVVHYESFTDVSQARERELQIKRWKSRKLIEGLIGLEHPDKSGGS